MQNVIYRSLIIFQGFPCVYSWMKTRDSAAYRAVLEPLQGAIRPERIYCDFESRLHRAATKLFPAATVKGCFLSYCTVSKITYRSLCTFLVNKVNLSLSLSRARTHTRIHIYIAPRTHTLDTRVTHTGTNGR